MAKILNSVSDILSDFFAECPWLFPLLTFLFCISCISYVIRLILSPFDEIDFPGFFSFLWRKLKSFGIFILLRLGIICRVEDEDSDSVPN